MNKLYITNTSEVEETKYQHCLSQKIVDNLACEMQLRLFLNGQQVYSTLCSPCDLEDLATGILVSEGLIRESADIGSIKVDDKAGYVYVESIYPSVNCNSDLAPHATCSKPLELSIDQILRLMAAFLTRSSCYRQTRAVHSAAFCNPGQIISFKQLSC